MDQQYQSVLNNALHAWSRIFDLSIPMRVRDDYIIETPVGAFRTAYSPSTHCMALFYARHPYDLMGGQERTDGSGLLEIPHKERPYMVKMYNIFHTKGAKWDRTDPRQQFDLSWLRREIPRVIHDLPRILIREANLHRTGPSTYSSAFIGYTVDKVDEDKYSAYVSTKTRHNHQLTSVVASVDTTPAGIIQRLFRAAGRGIANRHLGKRFPVTRVRLNEDGKDTLERRFKEGSMDDAILADFTARMSKIWEGQLPVTMGEMPLLPFMHAGEALKQRAKSLQETLMHNRGHFLRELGAFGVHVAIDGPMSATEALLIDKAALVGAQHRNNAVPHEWHGLLSKHGRQMISLDSAMHRTLFGMNPEAFEDLGYLNPQKHACSFAVRPGCLSEPDAKDTFRQWVSSLLLAPYGNLFEYIGEGGNYIHPQNVDERKMVQAKASNGMIVSFLPETQTLYAYYCRPKFISPNRSLPFDAADYLKEGKVLALPLDNSHSMQTIDFADYQRAVRGAIGDCNFRLDPAQKPEDDALNPGPLCTLRPASTPPIAAARESAP
jgi:hypothetical protein